MVMYWTGDYVMTIILSVYTVSQKKQGHFYFYCNFGKCWSIF